MGLFDFLKRDKHRGEEKITSGGVTFWAPKPISNEEYQRKRQAESNHLERKYDLSTVAGINAIPVPKHKEASTASLPSVTGKIEYYLLQKGGSYEKDGEDELALACYRKANQLMPMSSTAYQRESYMRLPRYLRKLRRFDEARAEEAKLNALFASGLVFDYGGDDPKTAKNRADYDWLWEFLPELCPKSFSGYTRMKNSNSEKYQQLVQAAKARGRNIK